LVLYDDSKGPNPNVLLNTTLTGNTTVPAQAPGDVDVAIKVPLDPAFRDFAPNPRTNLALLIEFCDALPEPAGYPYGALNSLTAIAPGPGTVSLAAGGTLTLPLAEYHASIPVTKGLAGMNITVAQSQLSAATGHTILWRPTLHFPPGDDGTYVVRLLGTGAGHAQLKGPATVLGSQTTVDLPVAFTMPEGHAGDSYDVILDVTHKTDPSRSAALRLTALLDPDSHVDQAQEASQLGAPPHKTPGFAPASLLAVLTLFAVSNRKRKRA
jgi:hypothetical protein